jgi:hypothetical protein
MTDKALDKLIEEIRKECAVGERLKAEYDEANAALDGIRQKRNASEQRYHSLKDLLDDHIYNGTDIIQAKLKMDNNSPANSFSGGTITGNTITAGQIAANAISMSKVGAQAIQATMGAVRTTVTSTAMGKPTQEGESQ